MTQATDTKGRRQVYFCVYYDEETDKFVTDADFITNRQDGDLWDDGDAQEWRYSLDDPSDRAVFEIANARFSAAFGSLLK